jgi:DMSO/TMAO reductase YedYZ molybdopterin-dependent catalytic subunit
MVTTERFPENMGNMFLGKPTSFGIAVGLFMLVILSVIIVNVWATGVSLNHPRHVQNILGSITDRLQWILFRKISSRQDLERSKVSQFFRINGYPPDTEEYRTISKENFVNYNLEVFGLVEHPLKLSLLDLYNMQKQQQVTEHFCIQGWTAIGEWGGVPVRYILELCKPFQSVRFAVFWSYQYTNNQVFYEVLDIEILKHPQTILAYEMNGETLNIAHGAPLRLRAETQLGYKMVKWIKSIEFVESYENIGMGQGGHREDNMYYGKRAGI